MNLILAIDVTQWILLGVLLLFIIVSPFIMRAKNKRDMQNAQKMMDNIKKGDTVLTASGVIGKVISLDTKEGYKTVTLETGNEKHKGYLTLDIAAIYANLSNPVVPETVAKVEQPAEVKEEQQLEDKQQEEKTAEQEVVEEKSAEVEINEVKKSTKSKKKNNK